MQTIKHMHWFFSSCKFELIILDTSPLSDMYYECLLPHCGLTLFFHVQKKNNSRKID